MSGKELVHKIRSEGGEIRIKLFSAHAPLHPAFYLMVIISVDVDKALYKIIHSCKVSK